jgi:hypothetical protein
MARNKKKSETPSEAYKAAQNPSAWFSSALRLQAAADIILKDQMAQELPYLQAVDAAGKEAVSLAIASPQGRASVEVNCATPNYLPAQLLYAFAIENALKGLALLRRPGLLNPDRVSRALMTHNLVELAVEAKFEVFIQETAVLSSLSQIGEWAGRYPIARARENYVERNYPIGTNPDSLLDWGSAHPIMQGFLTRALETFEKELAHPPQRHDSVTAFRPKTS